MRRNFLKATSLLEVLVVLGIISTTIVSSMLLVSTSFVAIRNNQTEDYVDGLIINVMEIAKSGSKLFVNDASFTSSINATSYFKLISDESQSFLERTFDGEITSCDESSSYKFSSIAVVEQTETPFKLPDICIQVLIKPLNISTGQFTSKTYYEMTVKAAYRIDNEIKLVTFKSNRYEPFQTVQR